jgi:hypothetical protein
MASRKRKLLRNEANIVAPIDEELANDSDSDTDCVPEISSSEESADENDVSDSGPGPGIDRRGHFSYETGCTVDPPGRLDGKIKYHKLVHIPPTKNDRTPT